MNQKAIGLPIDLKDLFLSAALLLTVSSHRSEAGWIVRCVSAEEVGGTLCPPLAVSLVLSCPASWMEGWHRMINAAVEQSGPKSTGPYSSLQAAQSRSCHSCTSPAPAYPFTLHIQSIRHISAYCKRPIHGSPFYSISRIAHSRLPTALLHKQGMVARAGIVPFLSPKLVCLLITLWYL